MAFSDVPVAQFQSVTAVSSLKRPSSFLAPSFSTRPHSLSAIPLNMPLSLSTKYVGSVPRITTRRPFPTSTIQPGTTVTTTQIVADAVTEVARGESVPFSPKEWIQQFDRNQTHVKVPFGNHSRELLWQKENVNL